MAEVPPVYADLIRKGGAPGLRDPGLSESAVYPRQTGYAHLIEEVAVTGALTAEDPTFYLELLLLGRATLFSCKMSLNSGLDSHAR